MGQRLQATRSADRDTIWLLMLLAAMEEASGPEFRAKRCDRELLDGLKSHLARPASPRGLYRYSNFSLRNQM